jgi:hypothetical protein
MKTKSKTTLVFIGIAASLVIIVLVYYLGQQFENIQNNTDYKYQEFVADMILNQQATNKINFGNYLAENFAKHFALRIAARNNDIFKEVIVTYLQKYYKKQRYTTQNLSSKLKELKKSDAESMLRKFQSEHVDQYEDHYKRDIARYLATDKYFATKFIEDINDDVTLGDVSLGEGG